jgi:hypothetical protein
VPDLGWTKRRRIRVLSESLSFPSLSAVSSMIHVHLLLDISRVGPFEAKFKVFSSMTKTTRPLLN